MKSAKDALAMQRSSLMAYCHLDAAEVTGADAALFDEICLASVGYMSGAGVAIPDADLDPERDASYWLCVKGLVLDGWDNRNPFVEHSATAENPAFRRRLNQLKQTEIAVPDSGTGGV